MRQQRRARVEAGAHLRAAFGAVAGLQCGERGAAAGQPGGDAVVGAGYRLRTLAPLAGGGVAFRNFGEGRVGGIEPWGRWHLTDSLHLSAGLVQQSIRSGLSAGSQHASGLTTNDPGRHCLPLASKDISERSQVDLTRRYQGSLPKPAIPAY